MNQFERLLQETSNANIIIVEKKLKSKAKGLCKGNKIVLNKTIETTKEKTCILAEELGHFYTTTGNIINLKDSQSRKQEQHARVWAYNKQIGLHGILKAYNNGCHDLCEIADFLEVTEEFLTGAISYYKNKYGLFTCLDNYIIYFEPSLGIMKRI